MQFGHLYFQVYDGCLSAWDKYSMLFKFLNSFESFIFTQISYYLYKIITPSIRRRTFFAFGIGPAVTTGLFVVKAMIFLAWFMLNKVV